MRIVFIGTGEIGVPTLEALLKSEHEVVAVVTQPDKPVGRAQQIEPPPIKKVLTRNGGFQTAVGIRRLGSRRSLKSCNRQKSETNKRSNRFARWFQM